MLINELFVEQKNKLKKITEDFERRKAREKRAQDKAVKNAAKNTEEIDLKGLYQSLQDGAGEYNLFSSPTRLSEEDRFELWLDEMGRICKEINLATTRQFKSQFILLTQSVSMAEQMIVHDKTMFEIALENVNSAIADIEIGNYTFPYESDFEYRLVKTPCSLPHYKAWGKIAALFDQSRPINVLDPICSQPDSFKCFANALPKTSRTMHAIVQPNIIDQMRGFADKIALGSATKITHGAFDIVMMAPWLSKEKEVLTLVPQDERAMVIRGAQYLRPGGWMVVELPAYRYDRRFCSLLPELFDKFELATYVDGTSITEMMAPVWFFGRKRAMRSVLYPKDMLGKLFRVWRLDGIKDLSDLQDKFEFPAETLEVADFRGSMMDVEEMRQIYQSSLATRDFFEDQSCRYMANENRRPLLKFNKGQTALVLTSGCLDGLIEEGDGNCHLVKGRVIKNVTETTEHNGDKTKTIVTAKHENRVEINAWLPTGQYVTLA